MQSLDLGIFGNQKKIKTRFNSDSKLSPNDRRIVEIINSWRKSTCPDAIVSAFNQAGIYVESTKDSTIVRASAEKARAVRGIEHISGGNVIEGRKTIKIPEFWDND